jgi:hypothetical protein
MIYRLLARKLFENFPGPALDSAPGRRIASSQAKVLSYRWERPRHINRPGGGGSPRGIGTKEVVSLIERSVAHGAHRVDAEAAERLESLFEHAFSEVEIRECLEDVQMDRALDVLAWAKGRPDPYPALRNWAVKHRKGFYRPNRELPSGEELGRREREYVARKERESRESSGCGLTWSEVERLVAGFHAPLYRAQMRRATLAERRRRNGKSGGAA